jgi:hypothetical protein
MKLWIARDTNGDIYLHKNKPYQKVAGIWTCTDQEFFWLGKEYFPEVTFENSPREVEIKLVK